MSGSNNNNAVEQGGPTAFFEYLDDFDRIEQLIDNKITINNCDLCNLKDGATAHKVLELPRGSRLAACCIACRNYGLIDLLAEKAQLSKIRDSALDGMLCDLSH